MLNHTCKHCKYYDPMKGICLNEREFLGRPRTLVEFRSPDDWCTRIVLNRCKRCGGQLEARTRIFNEKKEAWWHCYSCHAEFFED